MAITIVNQSVADVTYKVFGGSASGSGIGSGVSPSGLPSGVVASGIVKAGQSASGIVASGSPSFTVALDWVKAPSFAISASGVVTISTSVKG
jgi:hypothetical protein